MTNLQPLIEAVHSYDRIVIEAQQDLLNCTRAAEVLRATILLDAYENGGLTGKNQEQRDMQATLLLNQHTEYQEALAGEDAARTVLRIQQAMRDAEHRTWAAALAEYQRGYSTEELIVKGQQPGPYPTLDTSVEGFYHPTGSHDGFPF